MSLTCQKTLLAFLCQLDKIPNSLARHMSLTFHSLSPACPFSIISHIPCWACSLYMPRIHPIPGLCLAVHTACDAVSTSFTRSKLQSLTKITTPQTPVRQPRLSFTGVPSRFACGSFIELVPLGGNWCLCLCSAP